MDSILGKLCFTSVKKCHIRMYLFDVMFSKRFCLIMSMTVQCHQITPSRTMKVCYSESPFREQDVILSSGSFTVLHIFWYLFIQFVDVDLSCICLWREERAPQWSHANRGHMLTLIPACRG